MNKTNLIITIVAFTVSIVPIFAESPKHISYQRKERINIAALSIPSTVPPTPIPVILQITKKVDKPQAYCTTYGSLINSEANEWHIRPQLLLELIRHESGCNPLADSGKGDIGMAQINLPSHPSITVQMAQDPIYSIEFASRKLNYFINKYKDEKQALIRYNCGDNYDIAKYPNCGVSYANQILDKAK